MGRKVRYGSWIVLGVLLAVVIGVAAKLVAASPAALKGGIAYAQLGTPPAAMVTLPGRMFTCTLSDTVDRCVATVEGQSLEIAMRYPTSERVTFSPHVRCEATYGGSPVECGAAYDYAPGALPIANLPSGLGLSAVQIGRLQRSYPLDQASGLGWFRLTQQVAISAGLAVGLAVWLNSQYLLKVVTGLNSGLVTACLGYGTFMLLLPSFSSLLGWYSGPPLLTLAAVSLGIGGAVLLGGWTARQTPEAGSRIIVSLASGTATGLVLLGTSWVLRIVLLTSTLFPPSVVVAISLSVSGAVAISVWWRPLLVGRLAASLNSGLLAYCALAYSFLILMLGLGMID